MNYYQLSYTTTVDFLDRRTDYRSEHLSLVKTFVDRGNLLLAGALAGDNGGALLVFKAESEDVVRNFAERDPYVINGLVEKWQIVPWTVVAGSLM